MNNEMKKFFDVCTANMRDSGFCDITCSTYCGTCIKIDFFDHMIQLLCDSGDNNINVSYFNRPNMKVEYGKMFDFDIKLIDTAMFSDECMTVIFKYRDLNYRLWYDFTDHTMLVQLIDYEYDEIYDFDDDYTDDFSVIYKNVVTEYNENFKRINNSLFSEYCENISGIDCNGDRFGKPFDNGVSCWYFENEYNKFVGVESNTDEVEIVINGVKYHQHWFFVNEKHESSVCGCSLIDENNEHDVLFYVYGCKVDKVVSFNEMIDYLTNETYFIE